MSPVYFRSSKLGDLSSVPTAIALIIYASSVCGTTLAPRTGSTIPVSAITASTAGSAGPSLPTRSPPPFAKPAAAHAAPERPTGRPLTTRAFSKVSVKSASRQKSSATSARPQERPGRVGCDLPLLPRESRLWRGNETHELHLPLTACAGGAAARAGAAECPRVMVSWEGSVDVQSGDVLIVRISDSLLLDRGNKDSTGANSSRSAPQRTHGSALQPAVYQVTRQGHEHCDVSDGTLLDITPLDERAAKIFTLYDKDLTEGVNLLIVVSASWGSQCVRLKVTVKSDNCGDSQDCSGKGACYTHVSMEGYECQCCPGYAGPHCEERDACQPSPCLNNGICVDLTQPLNGAKYHCLCPFGFTGRKCEKDPCFSSPCLNGGSCMSMALNGSTTFRCACPEPWTGARCETPSAGGACKGKPCLRGICVEQPDEREGPDYRCFCEPGYTGDRCELEYNECESAPCVNGGTCTDRVGGFGCACGRGYDGPTCQFKVDLCLPRPCSERQVCVDRGGGYSCECPRGFVGDECHLPATSICDNNPCAHGGTCWSGVDSFYCSCRPGYTGRLCEEDFILEPVVEGDAEEGRGGGGVRAMRLPLGLYRDRLHNVLVAAGTLGAAFAIVGVVVTACHCRVNKTYSRLLSRLSARAAEARAPRHWLQGKLAHPTAPRAHGPPPPPPFDTTDLYYTLDLSDNQTSPLIQ